LGISEDKVFTNLHKYGNTSTASIPIALCEAIEQGRVKTNDRIVMVGFGGGLSWGATVVKWGIPMPYKRRQWWYRAMRWFVYTWARMRSQYLRTRRKVEGMVQDKENGYLLPDKDRHKKNGQSPKINPNGTKPEEPVDVPSEVVGPKVSGSVEIEEQPPEAEELTGGKRN
jgi:hypothetical protein